MTNLKKNFLFNLINTITGILFPVITLPYVFRVLLPDGVGVIDFYNSIISYIVLLCSLGIPIYAVKEVAKYRDDISNRNKISIEILLLSLILSFFGYLIVFGLFFFVSKIQENSLIFFVLSLSIFFNAIGIQWFYQAIENFKFLTVRAIAIRLIAVISIFIFVKTKDDLIAYAWIVVFASLGNNLLNFLSFSRYLSFSDLKKFRHFDLVRHIKPASQLFVLNLIISIYVNLDSVMLGFMKGNEAVGYYSSAVKFYRVVLTLVTSLGVVLLPRMSHAAHSNNIGEFNRLAAKSLNFTMLLALPLAALLILLSQEIILLFAGEMYHSSILVLQLLSPIIVFAGVTNVIGIQILYPINKQNLVIKSVAVAAVVNILLNLLLIPKYSSNGAAFSTLIAEFIVLLMQLFYLKKYVQMNPFSKHYFNYILATFLMVVLIFIIKIYGFDNLTLLIFGGSLGISFYLFILWIRKDAFFLELLLVLKKK